VVGVQVLQDFASQSSALRKILKQMQPLDVSPPPSCLETSSYLQINGMIVQLHSQVLNSFVLTNAIHIVVAMVQRIAAIL
jgi:hypothetical protein